MDYRHITDTFNIRILWNVRISNAYSIICGFRPSALIWVLIASTGIPKCSIFRYFAIFSFSAGDVALSVVTSIDVLSEVPSSVRFGIDLSFRSMYREHLPISLITQFSRSRLSWFTFDSNITSDASIFCIFRSKLINFVSHWIRNWLRKMEEVVRKLFTNITILRSLSGNVYKKYTFIRISIELMLPSRNRCYYLNIICLSFRVHNNRFL